jgi:hypothetical protein
MKELVTVVIPVFKNQLTETEAKSLEKCLETLEQFPVLFITGDDTNLDDLSSRHPSITNYRFENEYFKNRATFQKLLLRDEFYDRFDWSEFILVHELNSFVLKNELRYWCKQGYDFIQPCPDSLTVSWLDSFVSKKLAPQTVDQLSSAGLSLRRVGPMRKAIKKNKRLIYQFLTSQEPPVEAVFWEEQNHKILTSLITPTPVVRRQFARYSQTIIAPAELFAVTGIKDPTSL